MYTQKQVSCAATLVGHIMELRESSQKFKDVYPACWDSDLTHFVNMAANVAGVQHGDRAQFIEAVTSAVNEEQKTRAA